MIDRQTIDKIMEAANIVDVVSEFVSLRKSGASYKGLCPFHDDSTPSFYVSPARNICKCFSCGKGGSPVGFIMEHEQMTYPEALRWLAKRYHIEIRERELTNEERQAESERESMFIVNDWAVQYFQDILTGTEDGMTYGMQYYRSRGFRDDIIKKFRLGYDLQKRDALPLAARTKGYQEEFLLKTGLCYKRDSNGMLVDRFAGRVIFPWIGMSGKTVAFGGRLLDSRTKGVQQKYVNSPDSEIYHKDHELYGIYQAKKAIAKLDMVYMVEGYTDVISMHQCGIENVVANSGTALSVYQIRMLHRFTSNIVLLYDGDEAGIHAAMRGTDMLLSEGMNVKVLLLPDGDDPDSFARKHTAADFRQYIEEYQTDFIVFKINQLLKGVTDPIKRSEAVSSIVRSISVIKDQILRATYVRECANRTGVAEETIISSMNKMIHGDKEQAQREAEREREAVARAEETGAQPVAQVLPATLTSSFLQVSSASKVEDLLIQAVIRHGGEIMIRDVENEETGEKINLTVAQYISYDLGLDNLHFNNSLYNKILEEAVLHSNEEGFKSEDYFTHHSDIDISRLAVTMSVEDFRLSESLQIKERENSLRDRVMHMVLDFRMDYVEQRLKDLRAQLSKMGDDMEKMMQTMSEIKQMQEIRNVLARRLGNDIVV